MSRAGRFETRTRLAGTAALLAVLLAGLVVTRLWLVARPPAFSDIPAYWHDAELWGAAGRDGTSFYDLHAEFVVQAAHGLGRDPAEGTTLIEYPPLAMAFVAAVNAGMVSSPAPDDSAQLAAYAARYRQLAFLTDLAVLAVLAMLGAVASAWRDRTAGGQPWRWTTPWRLAVYGVGGMAAYYILYDRLDLFVGVLLLASLLALVQGWWRTALVVLGVAIAFKVYPAVLAPIWLVGSLPAEGLSLADRHGGWRSLARPLLLRVALLGATVAAIFLPFVVAQGPDVFEFVAFNAQRGVQIESVPAALAEVLRALGLVPATIVNRYGAYEVSGPLIPLLAVAAIPLSAAAVAVPWWLFARAARRALAPSPAGRMGAAAPAGGSALVAGRLPRLVVTAAVATLAAAWVTGKVLSPQYLLWLLPLVPLLEGGRGVRAWQVGFVAALALSTVIFPGLYDPLTLDGALVPAIVARDLLLIGLAAGACARLMGPWNPAPSDPAPSSRRSGTTTSWPRTPARPPSSTSTCTSSTRSPRRRPSPACAPAAWASAAPT